VLVDDLERHVFGFDPLDLLRSGEREDLAGCDAVTGGERLAVESRRGRVDDAAGGGTGDPAEHRHHLVEAFPVEVVRDREPQSFTHEPIRRTTTATVIDASARLNVGMNHRSIQSITGPSSRPGPRAMRSTRLPAAPPITNPMPTTSRVPWGLRRNQRMSAIATIAATPKTDPAPWNIEKAAPVFSTNRNCKKLPMTSTGSEVKVADAQRFVRASRRTTAAAIPTAMAYPFRTVSRCLRPASLIDARRSSRRTWRTEGRRVGPWECPGRRTRTRRTLRFRFARERARLCGAGRWRFA